MPLLGLPQEILLSMVWWSGLVCVLNGPEKSRKIEIALPYLTVFTKSFLYAKENKYIYLSSSLC